MPFVRSIVHFIFVLFIILKFGDLVSVDHLHCFQTGPCSCRRSDNFTIDLHHLANNNTPRFQVKIDNVNSSISLNFCHSFTLGSENDTGTCGQEGGVAVCLENGTNKETESWGTQRSSKIIFNSHRDLYEIEYTDNNRGVILALNCNDTYLGQPNVIYREYNKSLLTHFLEFHAVPCACNGTCDDPKPTAPPTGIPSTTANPPTPTEPPNPGLSTGSILLIVFFLCILLYLIGGSLYKKFVLGAVGVEMIPNIDFWMDFPVLVKDGVKYLFSCCNRGPSYDNI